jgi:CelD/BcsL family acetyltransferase involved in cellulose biosynthesis
MAQMKHAVFDARIDAKLPDLKGDIDISAIGLLADIRLSLHFDLLEVESDWRDFEKEADCTAFQNFDWLSIWYRHIGTRERVKPAIVVGRHNGSIIFILPLAFTARTGLRRVAWLGGSLCNYNAPLLARGFSKIVRPAQFVRLWGEIQQLLRSNLRHDLIDLEKIPATVGAQANPMLALQVTPHANDSYVTHLTGNWDEFYQSKRSSSWRKTDAKKRRRLAKYGDIQFATAVDRADIERTIDALIEEKKSSYASLGVANMFEWPGYRDFFLDVASDPRRHSLVHVSSIKVGSTIVAASFGLTMHGTYDYLLAGYTNGEMEVCSPGSIHLQELMRYFTERGFKIFDFNIGDEPYKHEWCDTEVKLYDQLSPATLLGLLAATAIRAVRRLKRSLKRSRFIWPVIRRARSIFGSLAS